MKALYKTAPGPGNMEIREAPLPKPGPNEVMVEIKVTGVCGSDIHIMHSDIAIPTQPPVITGHEFAGVISEVGADIQDWKVGDRVTSETAVITCDKCIYCRTGRYNLCPGRRVLGYWVNGAFAKYTVVPARRLHPLGDSISFRVGAMTEPLACCVHAVNELTTIQAGDVVAVVGPGAIGLMCMQLAQLEGAKVIVCGTASDTDRLRLAKELGAAGTIDNPNSAVQIMEEYTEGRGADVVLECSGSEGGAGLGIQLARRGAQFTQIGLFGKPIKIDFEKIAYKELKVTGSIGSIWTSWRKALQFIANNQVQLEPLISAVYPVTEWEQAFAQFEKRQGLKIMIEPVD